jgi:predicted PurR-regulated permease PerM
VLTVAMIIVVAVPFAIVLVSVGIDAYDLLVRLSESPRGREVLSRLVARGESRDPWHMLLAQREHAWTILQQIAGTATSTAVGIFVFIAGTYALLVDGQRWYAWLRAHAPLAPQTTDRFAAAFYETGRGLLIGIGGAGLAQSIVATITLLILDVPHAFALGLLTLIASVFPAVGSALVWVPVTIALAIAGRTTEAVTLGVVGVTLISSIDNLIRPVLARRGNLQLPSFVVLVAMFGGVATIGGWGLLIAPLVIRLAKEAVEIAVPSPSEASRDRGAAVGLLERARHPRLRPHDTIADGRAGHP